MYYPTWPGALVGTVGSVGMSMLFSVFLSASTRYSLVYGSLASMILLMLWLYFFCQILYVAAAFNIALLDIRSPELRGEKEKQ